MYSISLIWMFQQFPFTCEWLNEASNKLFQFVEKPFLITFSKKQNDEKSIKNNETSIATMSEGTVYLVPMETDMIEEFNEQEILWNEEIIQDEEIVQDEEVSWNEENSWNEKAQKPVISKIAKLKSLTIDQVLNEQESYSSDVCELLVNEINSKFWLENFKWSVILLIYLLLYWFIRISFWVMSGIAFIIFKILYRCRVYKISETTKKVDEIH